MAVRLQLFLHNLQISQGIIRTSIHHMNQQTGALNVAKEVMTEAGTLGSTGDQAGDIGKNSAIAGRPTHHTEIRHQCGEGVVGDLWTGR